MIEVFESGFAGALTKALETGGQLFSGRSRDSSHSVVRGSKVWTFWEPESKQRQEVRKAARMFGFDEDVATGGRLARYILREIVGLNTEDTVWGGRFRSLAKDGFHWHYQKCLPGYHPYLLEFDLKSAYFASLFQGESLLYSQQLGWLKDGGALDNLKGLYSSLPKWLRVCMLGVLCSHQIHYYRVSRDEHEGVVLCPHSFNKIDYGGAFNAAHGAVLRTYRTMQRIDEMAGDAVKRCHTDSFAMSMDISPEKETAIFDYLDERGYECSVKGSGTSYFFNLNEGFIGSRMIGSYLDVMESMKREKLTLKREFLNYNDWMRWRERLGAHKPEQIEERAVEQITEWHQMRIDHPLLSNVHKKNDNGILSRKVVLQ